jgi:hypothetical protein
MHILFSLRKPEGAGKGPISGRTLMFDAQSKRYIFSEDTLEGTTCSICLEFLGKQAEQLHHFVFKPLLSKYTYQRLHDLAVPEDDAVTGLCSHTYHRECIMSWLLGGHDECPNCRQPMWDPEIYEMVDHEIKDQNSGISSAPPTSMFLT